MGSRFTSLSGLLVGAAALVAVTGAGVGAGVGAGAGTNYTSLRADPRVQGELLGASMAYILNEECPDIRLRRIKMVTYALSLASYAKKNLGYSSKEVEAYVNDKEEQARFREMAMARLAERGAVAGDTESFCAVGRAEMEKGSYVGSMIKGG